MRTSQCKPNQVKVFCPVLATKKSQWIEKLYAIHLVFGSLSAQTRRRHCLIRERDAQRVQTSIAKEKHDHLEVVKYAEGERSKKDEMIYAVRRRHYVLPAAGCHLRRRLFFEDSIALHKSWKFIDWIILACAYAPMHLGSNAMSSHESVMFEILLPFWILAFFPCYYYYYHFPHLVFHCFFPTFHLVCASATHSNRTNKFSRKLSSPFMFAMWKRVPFFASFRICTNFHEIFFLLFVLFRRFASRRTHISFFVLCIEHYMHE